MTSILKFFLGILLVQAFTAVQVLLALRSEQPEVWLMLGLFAASTGFLAALWLKSLAGHAARDAVARAEAGLSKERERVRTRAEREKAKVVAQSQQEIARARSRAESRASLKVGALVAGVAGLGGLVLLTQFVTLGLLALSSAGGAVGGYLFRLRQEQQRRRREVPALTIEHAGTEKLPDASLARAGRLLPEKGANAS